MRTGMSFYEGITLHQDDGFESEIREDQLPEWS